MHVFLSSARCLPEGRHDTGLYFHYIVGGVLCFHNAEQAPVVRVGHSVEPFPYRPQTFCVLCPGWMPELKAEETLGVGSENAHQGSLEER
jgi:hypothetical protein